MIKILKNNKLLKMMRKKFKNIYKVMMMNNYFNYKV